MFDMAIKLDPRNSNAYNNKGQLVLYYIQDPRQIVYSNMKKPSKCLIWL